MITGNGPLMAQLADLFVNIAVICLDDFEVNCAGPFSNARLIRNISRVFRVFRVFRPKSVFRIG